MKYVVSSQEKPQNFPIYSMHSDMDSFILYNDEIYPPTNVNALALEKKKFINKESSIQEQEIAMNNDISDPQEKRAENKEVYLPIKQIIQTPNPDYKHETLWYLEFDGLVNKLGAGVGIWVHNIKKKSCWRLCIQAEF